MCEKVILVDENDLPIGEMDKLEAHQKNCLHRAFSIILWNDKNQMLIHQRAEGKYHSAGLWTNTCCSHPRPEELTLAAVHRRLHEEMGIATELKHAFYFVYQTDLENNLAEHELDHVFLGKFDGIPNVNPEEAQDFRWVSLEDVRSEIQTNPNQFTYWFNYILAHFTDKITPDFYESL